jgi:hypothetical protein
VRDEGSKEFSDETPPHTLTFVDTIIVSTPPSFILQEGVISRIAGVIKRSRRRPQVTRGLRTKLLLQGTRSSHDWLDTDMFIISKVRNDPMTEQY